MQFYELGRRLWRPGLVAITIAVVIAVGSLMPAKDVGSVPGNDLAHHILAYCLLSFFAGLAVRGRLNSGLVMLGVFGYGFALELIQPFFGRAFDLSDLIANGAGVLAGAYAALAFHYAVERLGREH